MRYHPDTHRHRHQRIRGQTTGRRKEAKRDHPLPQTAHHPRDLPPPHQPAPNPKLREATQPAPTRRHHHHPGRPSSPHPPQPNLSTRTRPKPQPPPRHPIPEVAPNPPAQPTHPTDLTNTHNGRGLGPGDRSDPLTNWPVCLFYDLSACLRPGNTPLNRGSGVT